MSDITNPLQNISYTNKDFTSIYTELLDLAKQLAATWDPTISNESDPGVILIKLNAIIGDKLSYNSDTNVLELFPLSVTQEKNARQLFEQLGYYMHWYKGAITNVAITWIGNKVNQNDETAIKEYTIPAFSMVSDYNNGVIYTLIGPSDGTTLNTYKVADQKLKLDGSTTSFKAIQGIPVQYTINGESLITINHLDSNNRLYFSTTDIAENGIFITNVGANNYTDWKKVDNLLIQTLSPQTLTYRFGVSQDTSTCYIEFPENAEEIFRNGINITYIKTLGEEGNVSYRTIEKFYTELSPVEDNTVTLNIDNTRILNYSSAINGMDPETINNAYRGYKSTVGTFETLVTLRDYIGYIYNSGLVSNDFVCDRTNDIQVCYDVMTQTNDIDQTYTMIEEDENEHPVATAFDLKLFLLQSPIQQLNTMNAYTSTFDLIPSSQQNAIKTYISDIKCISHDYADILPIDSEHSHFCMFKNKYPISCRITTQYALTKSAANELTKNVREALYKNLNSREVSFGEEVPFELVYKIISEADDRIKNVYLDNIEYTTYAVIYLNEDYYKGFVEVEISSPDEEPVSVTDASFDLNKYPVTITDNDKLIKTIGYTDTTAKFTLVQRPPLPYYFWKINDDTDVNKWIQAENLAQSCGITVDNVTYGTDLVVGDNFTVSLSLKTQLQNELYTKSVLAGVTQFFVQDETFDYNLNQIYNSELSDLILKNISKLSTNLNVELNSENDFTYTLRQNEAIQLYAPNILDGTSYSSYVKFEYTLYHPLPADTDYELQQNEWFIMYWKENADTNYYKYAVYGQGNIIRLSNFDLLEAGEHIEAGEPLTAYATAENNFRITSDDYNAMTYDISLKVAAITNTTQLLSTTKTITQRLINQVTLFANDTYCYWVLNESIDVNGQSKYRLFEANEYSYMLGTGEYFIYTNSLFTNLTILGAGTLIERSDATRVWEVKVKDASDITLNGINAFEESDWFTPPANSTITLVEQKYDTLTEGQKIKLRLIKNYEDYIPITYANIEKVEMDNITVTVDSATFYSLLENVNIGDEYTFDYLDHGQWQNDNKAIDLNDYGISVNQLSDNSYVVDYDKFINNPVISASRDTGVTFGFQKNQGTNNWAYNAGGSDYTEFVPEDWGMEIPEDAGPFNITYYALRQNESKIIITIPTYYLRIDRDNMYVNNTPIAGLSDFNVYFTDFNGNFIQLEQLQLNNSQFNWRIRTLLGINLSNTQLQNLLTNQSITTTADNYYRSVRKINGGDGTDYSIQVPNSSDIIYFSIPANKSGYVIYDTLTNKLYLNDTEIIYSDISNTSEMRTSLTNTYLLEGQDIDENGNYPVSLLSSFEVKSDGNKDILTYTLDEDLNVKYLNLYVFEQIGSTPQSLVQSDGEIDLILTPTSSQVFLQTLLPEGEYILPMTLTSDLTGSGNHISVYYCPSGSSNVSDKVKLYIMGDSTFTNFVENKKYFLDVKKVQTGGNPATFLFRVEDANGDAVTTDKNITLLLSNIYKYVKPNGMTSNDFKKFVALIEKWDIKNLYNYIYTVDSDEEISNPLLGKSFFLQNHIYNEFTIPQISSIDINVLGKI